MLLFRSEEHVERWNEHRGTPAGATFTPRDGWNLARAWFDDRLSPEWRRKSPEEAKAIFDAIGLTGAFWDLDPPVEVSSTGAGDTPDP
jgi:hypothetical protein